MGHKAHSHGLRLGINQTWSNAWSGSNKDYKTCTQLYIEVDRLWKSIVDSNLYDNISVQINKREILIFVNTHKPNMMIGPKGANINKIQSKLQKGLIRVIPNFKEMKLNINLKIKESAPEISPMVICQQLNDALIAKKDFKRTIKYLAELAMENGALGLLVKVSGRIGGRAIASSFMKKFGSIPLQTLNMKFNQGQKHVLTKSGVCGVTCIVALASN